MRGAAGAPVLAAPRTTGAVLVGPGQAALVRLEALQVTRRRGFGASDSPRLVPGATFTVVDGLRELVRVMPAKEPTRRPAIAAARSLVKDGLPVKNGSIRTALPAKSRRKAEWPNARRCSELRACRNSRPSGL